MKKLFCVLTLCCLSACGFTLRGHASMPAQLKKVYLETSSPYSSLSRTLKHQLKLADIDLVSDQNKATVTLEITDLGTTTTLSSVSANTQVRQYMLVYAITYQLFDLKHKSLVKPQHISTRRYHTVNADQVLGSTQEQEVLLREMQQDVIYQLLKRLSSDDTVKALKG